MQICQNQDGLLKVLEFWKKTKNFWISAELDSYLFQLRASDNSVTIKGMTGKVWQAKRDIKLKTGK